MYINHRILVLSPHAFATAKTNANNLFVVFALSALDPNSNISRSEGKLTVKIMILKKALSCMAGLFELPGDMSYATSEAKTLRASHNLRV